MSMKIVLVAAASVMAVTPAFAMKHSSKSAIVSHTGGPIPYSQLESMDKSGYNARSHRGAKKTTAPLGDENAAPSATPSPDTSVNPSPAPATTPPAPAAPEASTTPSAPPASPPSSPGAAPPATTPQ